MQGLQERGACLAGASKLDARDLVSMHIRTPSTTPEPKLLHSSIRSCMSTNCSPVLGAIPVLTLVITKLEITEQLGEIGIRFSLHRVRELRATFSERRVNRRPNRGI